MGTKREKERGQTAADSHHGTHGSRRIRGQAEGRQTGREERGARMASRLGSGGGGEQRGTEDTRQQRGNRESRQTEKKEYVIFKGDKERKTPPRLAKACKCVHIHITQYRGVWAVYCTFFYILRGYIVYIYIYNISPSNVYFSFKVNGIKIFHYYIWIVYVYFTIRV